jgi:hypothetical protein
MFQVPQRLFASIVAPLVKSLIASFPVQMHKRRAMSIGPCLLGDDRITSLPLKIFGDVRIAIVNVEGSFLKRHLARLEADASDEWRTLIEICRRYKSTRRLPSSENAVSGRAIPFINAIR